MECRICERSIYFEDGKWYTRTFNDEGEWVRVSTCEGSEYFGPLPDHVPPMGYVRQPDGLTPAYFVGVYEVSRSYGGPEEGGWWFDCGELVLTVVAASTDEAETIKEHLREQDFPRTNKRSSVLGGEDYDIFISEGEMPAPFFPEERPFYE
jgi:hypothetical protein